MREPKRREPEGTNSDGTKHEGTRGTRENQREPEGTKHREPKPQWGAEGVRQSLDRNPNGGNQPFWSIETLKLKLLGKNHLRLV